MRRMVNGRGLLLSTVIALWSCPLIAQQNSEFGWALHPHDTLRVCVLFVEIDYDESGELEKEPQGNAKWPVGSMPLYADELFDPYYFAEPKAMMSTHYREISLNNLVVLGDYYPELLRFPYSQVRNSPNAVLTAIGQQLGDDTTFSTKNGLVPSDFDFRENSTAIGKFNEPSDGSKGFDHVMVILRNYHRIPDGTGQASPYSNVKIGGRGSDSYSIFGGGRGLPFGIVRHELNHLFLGSNNFHAGGGNGAPYTSYFFSVQGGWSMMGAANSSLLTCAAWDRYRLGWKAEGNQFLISARNEANEEVSADLDASKPESAGVYILRDFLFSGDAVRIKLPFIPEEEFQQWIWIENHTTGAMTGSQFDLYQYADRECTASTPAGLFLQMQVDAEEKEGKSIFTSVFADYLRPMPANGFYDFIWQPQPLVLEEYCVNGVDYKPYTLDPSLENPFSGNHEQEISYRDFEEPIGLIDKADGIVPMTRITPGGIQRFNFMGGADHAFRADGNSSLGLGTNPSSANMLTLINNRKPRKADPRNNRTTYLNGVRFDILETYPDGSIKISIRFDDNMLDQNRRWCAPKIVLNNHVDGGHDLIVSANLELARGETPLRFDAPDTLGNGLLSFSEETHMTVAPEASMHIEGKVVLKDQSVLGFSPNASLSMQRKAKLTLEDQAELHMAQGSMVSGKGRIRVRPNALVVCADEEAYRHLRKRTCNKRRVILEPR